MKAWVKLLLQKGIDLESKANDNFTLLSYAVWVGNEAAVQLLLERGADMEVRILQWLDISVISGSKGT